MEALWKEANMVVSTSDNGEDRNLHVGTTTMTTSAMIMGGAEVTRENGIHCKKHLSSQISQGDEDG